MHATTSPSAIAVAPRRLQGPALANVVRYLAVAAAGLLLPAALLALWLTAVHRQWMPEQILPPPALVWQSLQELWATGELLDHLLISAGRVGWSLLIGGSAGLALGFGMGLSRTLRAYLFPTFDVVSQFPVLGWIPLLIILAGIDEALKVTAISIAVVVPVAINTLHGIANIPHTQLEVAAVYRFSLPQVVRRVVLPSAAPSLFNGLRQAVMQAWLTLVFVELLASSEGIGYLMVWGRQLGQLDLVVVGMVVIGAVGVGLDLLLRWAEASMLGWRRTAF
ncbi:ABC transporter permease [Rhizobacter sp. LjRoot28]|uniref:ABC transporter permease n=1 Tax=Rhizobacter sp. LjRoot28 TaxID=3342309 RepID=UPI003ECD3172